jgi:hypothetical protein
METKARSAGILSIICGAFGILNTIGSAFYLIFMSLFFFNIPFSPEIDAPFESFEMIRTVSLSTFIIYNALVSGLGIAGGIFALKRKKWGIALAGAISGVVTFLPGGIAAVILISQAQKEFSTDVQEVT